MADGSVKFIKNSIERDTYRAIGTRQAARSSEVISIDSDFRQPPRAGRATVQSDGTAGGERSLIPRRDMHCVVHCSSSSHSSAALVGLHG